MSKDVLNRYQKAQSVMQGVLTGSLVKNDKVYAHWIDGSHYFWYQKETKEGKIFQLVDAEFATSDVAFDHVVLASKLSTAVDEAVDPWGLPIEDVQISINPLRIYFQAFDQKWFFESGSLTNVATDLKGEPSFEAESTDSCFHQLERKNPGALRSPDGNKSIFIRENNLWLRDLLTGKEISLTSDGTSNFCYGGSYLGADPEVHALWSPDSKRVVTVRVDSRSVVSRPIVDYLPEGDSVNPRVERIKLAYASDEEVEKWDLVVIEVDGRNLQVADYQALTSITLGYGFFRGSPLGWCSHDNRRAFFVDMGRGVKKVRIVELDMHTGSTRVLFEECSDSFVKLSHSMLEIYQFLPLPETDELVWFSERSGWAHLYLYDMNTGELKHAITKGEWLVREILHYDSKQRELFLHTTARDGDINPYYRDICKVNIDTCELTTILSGCFDHRVFHSLNPTVVEVVNQGLDYAGVSGFSPCGKYIVATYSRVDTPPVSILLNRDGQKILTIEVADVSGLPEGWQWPEPVKLKGADEKTDIYGVMYRPADFSENKKYPVVDYSCSMRSLSTLPLGSFINSVFFGFDYLYASALAALGFVVVVIEGRGTPLRNKEFTDYHSGDIAYANDFSDRIAGMRQLAKRYQFMDLERVGITGHENQTNNVYALLKHSYFYKVAVVNCLYDPRFAIAPDEQYYLVGDGAEKIRWPEDCIESFGGKLLLIQGMMSHLTPTGTFRLVQALQKANKDFDMLLLPKMVNFITNYTVRREWDYLISHLQDISPPFEFPLKTNMLFWDS